MTTELSPVLLAKINAKIIALTLNRPERCNAFSEEMLTLLLERLTEIAADPTCLVVLLQGAGKAFCSGLDFVEATQKDDTTSMKSVTPNLPHRLALMVADVLIQLRRIPQIVIASVHGSAFGGGGAMIAASDLVVAANGFRMGFPEVRRGLEPALLFPILRRKLSDSVLRQMILTGLPIDAQRAKDFGLVHHIVEPDEREEMTRLLAREVCAGEPSAVKCAKRMLQSQETPFGMVSFEEEMQKAVERHTKSWFSESAREGITAFLEKRVPVWNQDT